MIRRLFADEADTLNDWIYRDTGRRTDFTEFLGDLNNVTLACGDGGAFFAWRGPGIFEVHLFLEQRGKEAFRTVREMLSIMREEHGAKLFWAMVPVESRNVIMFARLMGWKPQEFRVGPQGRCQVFTGE